MIQPIKHNAINWVDGMKVSQMHLNEQDNFIIDSIRDSNSLQINNFNYGLLPMTGQFSRKLFSRFTVQQPTMPNWLLKIAMQ